jgi:CHAT domain-containing protein/tetratricopeptide (TPR) repeat protein
MRTGADFDEEDLSAVLNNLGLFYYERGRNTEAEKCLTEALGGQRRALAADDPKLLDSLNNVGLVYIAQQRYDEAEPILREVLEARRRTLIPDHPNIAQSLFNLGMLYADMGWIAEALPLLKEQFEAEDRLLANVFSVTSENERLAYAVKLRQQLDILLMRLISWRDRADAVTMAFEGVLRRKGIVAEAVAKERLTTLAGEGSPARTLLEELNAVRNRLARGILDGPAGDAAAHGIELSRLNAERQRLETKFARALAGMKVSTQIQVDRTVVAEALPPGSALLEFVKFQMPAIGTTPDERCEAYAMFVLADREPENIVWSPLGLAETIESAVELFRGAITQDGETFHRLRNIAIESVDVAKAEISIGTELTKTFVDRIRPVLGARKRLFISPDGILNQLPFEALPVGDSARIGEEFEISYLSSGRDLIRIHSTPQYQSGPAVVVADPDFNLAPISSTRVTAPAERLRSFRSPILRFDPLPDTKKEGEWVASRLGVEPWTGAQALETKVKSCQSPRVLHLATHGFFLSQNPHRNVTRAQSGTGTAPIVLPRGDALDNPLLRSGVALAGANRWLEGEMLPPEAEDGLLTAEDVCAMNLLGTELVVLSACDTGLGEYRTGEGIFGLRRAFELAGARSLVISLWRVPSGPTRELMQEFYRQLALGKRRSQALREAQRIVRRRYAETFYWGAFVLSGDPAPMHIYFTRL